MSINAQIIDQRLQQKVGELSERASNELGIREPAALRSLAFLHLCVAATLAFDDDEAFDCLTEGGGDLGVDAMHVSGEQDGEFAVTLFQVKYKTSLSGDHAFPATGIEKLLGALRTLFDPSSDVQSINERLRVKMEEARSLIRDGFIPRVRTVACINGRRWQDDAQELIDRYFGGDQVTWDFVNHDTLVQSLQATKSVDDTVQLVGKAIVEDLDYKRILIGRISATELAALIARHGDRVLERNIRRYLGSRGNRVNDDMRRTLESEDRRNFYVYNNGVTMICDSFSYNALQGADYKLRLKNLQIINGGQTCMTIERAMSEQLVLPTMEGPEAYVMLRLYELPSDQEDLIQKITLATNSQNPVDLRDLKSNDPVQLRLELGIRDLGFSYRRKRSSAPIGSDITSGVAAEAVLSVLRRRPHQAKFFAREHFGKLYDEIFTSDLNAAQVVVSVLLYRIAENHRRRPLESDAPFVRYGSCFIAMQMGTKLFCDLGVEVGELTHLRFEEARRLIRERGEAYCLAAQEDIATALSILYGARSVTLQQLSATFRRGDLIDHLRDLPGS